MAKKPNRQRKRRPRGQQPQPAPPPIAPVAIPSQQVQAAPAADGSNGQDQAQDASISESVDRYARSNLLLTAAIAAATVIQAFVSYFQWDAMDRGLKQTDTVIDQMRSEQRAWLTASPPTTAFDPFDLAWPATMMLTNSGQTPAFVSIAGCELLPWGEEAGDNFLKPMCKKINHPVTAIVPPGGQMPMPLSNIVSINKDQLAEAAKEKLFIYVISRVVYKDVSGVTLDFGFCYRFDPKANLFRVNPAGNYMRVGGRED